MDIPLDELIYVEGISSASTGAAVDADSTPTFAVYEEATDTDIGVGGNMTKRTGLTGDYRASFTASAANGFEAGKWYSVIGSALIGGITCKGLLARFRITPVGSDSAPDNATIAATFAIVSTYLDVAVSSRLPAASYAAPDNAGIAATYGIVSTYLDATVSSRLPSASYVPPDNATIAAIQTTAVAIAAQTDKLTFDGSNRVVSTVGAYEAGMEPSATWDELRDDHTIPGSFGEGVGVAGFLPAVINEAAVSEGLLSEIAAYVCSELVPGLFDPGTLGHKIGTYLDATISSRMAAGSYVVPDNATIAATYAIVSTNLDATVSSRLASASYVAPANATIAAIHTIVSTNLDVAVSSRLASASYVAPANATIAAINAIVGQFVFDGGRVVSTVGAYQANMAPLQPITAGNKLAVTPTGATGINWGQVENQGATVNLSVTTINTVNTAGSVTAPVTISGPVSVTGVVEANVVKWMGEAPAALVGGPGGRLDASVGVMQPNVITPAAFLVDAISAAAMSNAAADKIVGRLMAFAVEVGIVPGPNLVNESGDQLTAITFRQLMTAIGAALAGVLSGAEGLNVLVRPPGKPAAPTRIDADVDEHGNRPVVRLRVPD